MKKYIYIYEDIHTHFPHIHPMVPNSNTFHRNQDLPYKFRSGKIFIPQIFKNQASLECQ